jgi:hypothetical protein
MKQGREQSDKACEALKDERENRSMRNQSSSRYSDENQGVDRCGGERKRKQGEGEARQIYR